MSNEKTTKKTAVVRLCFCASAVALAAVTSLVRLYSFPFGGSVTLCSMFFIMLPSYFFGFWEGAACGLVCGLIQFGISPYFLTLPQFLLDYILAFSVMAVAAFFRNKKRGLLLGYIAAVFARWAVATLAGLAWVHLGSVAWEGWSPLPYSMAYNAAYIFTEAAVTALIIAQKPVERAVERVKAML